jgi:quinol monooxygenase YgiN
MTRPDEEGDPMIVIAGSARCQADKRDEAVAAARAMATASVAESGCLAYRFTADLDDPCLLHVFEKWESAEALDAHFATPHMAEFMTALGAVLDGSPDIRRFEVTSEAPLLG